MSSMTKQSARERITSLFDENSFVEVGALVTKRNTDFNLGAQEVPADGVVTGYGLVNGNLVYAYSQDADALGGSMGEMHARKIAGIYDLATKCGAPVVGILDCQGLRLQEGCDALDAFGQVYAKQALAAGVIPQISAVLGVCGGGAAVLAGLSDFTVMTKENAKLFVNAPNTLDGNYTEKNNTAGAAFQSEQGNVDILAEDDADALNKVRELLSVLPLNNEDGVFSEECTDDLNRTVESLAGLKDAAVIAREISDNRQFIELKKDFAKGIVTVFIKLNGMTVGFVGNRSEILDDSFKCVEKTEPKLCPCRAK
ncbi:MAG: carboxyl transferase, partial [Lachnospiraceae bacterium]|nr:carboxyl transferase [Lachnospiraceae bacterium]